MKKIYKCLSLLAGLFAAVTISGCDAEKDLRIVEAGDAPLYENMYIVGYGAGNNFDSNNALAMDKTDNPNVFSYRAEMRYYSDNKQFKFCTAQANWDEIYYIIPSAGVVSGKQYAYATFGEEAPNQARICSQLTGDLDDHFWGIHEGEDGIYDIFLNVKEMTVTVVLVEKLGEKELELEQLFIIGDATPAGWNISMPYPMEKVSTNVFRYEGPLYQGEMKCPINDNGKWEDEFLMPVTHGTVIDRNGVVDPAVEYVPTGNPDSKWKIEERGNYEIVIDASNGMKAITIAARFLGELEPEPELYMLGSAANTWDSANGLYLDSEDGNTFTWEGEILYNADNKQFKFCTAKGPWDQVDFLIPEAGDSDNFRELVEDGGVYKMKKLRGPGNPLSASWGISQENSGNYRIEVDAEGMTLYVSRIN